MRTVRVAGTGIILVALGIAAALEHASIGVSAKATVAISEGAVDPEGHLHVPRDYRTTYQFLGSWAIAADEGRGAKELHVVYASPGAIDDYRQHGHFPDGAVLIKEVFKTATNEMTTGSVSRADTLKGWFVMMKDDANRHPGNALWGDGWGWSWFDAADPSKTTSTNYNVDCQVCHVPAQSSDWVYVDGYAPLRR